MTAQSFRDFIKRQKAKLGALANLVDRPYGKRVSPAQLEEFAAEAAKQDPLWTLENLWPMFDGKGPLSGQPTDWVPLIRCAAESAIPVEPYRDSVRRRLMEWLERNLARDVMFNAEQQQWLEAAADHFAIHLQIQMAELDGEPFTTLGGLTRAQELFGDELSALLNELSETLY